MSDNPLALLQQGGSQVPAVFHPLMQQMQGSEMQANVGASYAVVTIKGKVFGIKYGGQTTPITVNMNGQLYAAPYFDVVIPRAKSELSKTYYPSGYTEGSDEQPTCWSEDGIAPLAPEAQRPIDPATGRNCTDCRMCPMNQFGSKISDNGSKGKACADTRKVIIVPVDPATGQMDADNVKYGGPMLLRVPAASLRVFAEYDQKLQAMGVPYFAVVTRMEFDQTQAYPKFVLRAVRFLSEAEGQRVVELRESPAVRQILESGQTVAAPRPALPAPDTAALAGGSVPASIAAAAPQAPVQPQPPVSVPAQPAANVVPIHAPAAPLLQPAAPVPAAPTPPVPAAPTPPVRRMTLKAAGASYEAFKANNWTDEALIAEGYMEDPAGSTQPAAPLAPVPPQAPAVQAAAVAATPPPATGPQVTPALLATVDALLAS
jgi:hypothetical protein